MAVFYTDTGSFNNLNVTGSTILSSSAQTLKIIGSGSSVLSITGSTGPLFEVTDDLSSNYLTVISGSVYLLNVASESTTITGSLIVSKGGANILEVNESTSSYFDIISGSVTLLNVSSGSTTISGSLRVSGSILLNGSPIGGYSTQTVTTTHNETITSGNKIILGNTTGGAFSVNLPTAVGNTAMISVKKVAGTPALTVDANSTETIDGGLTAVINRVDESITLIASGSNWFII